MIRGSKLKEHWSGGGIGALLATALGVGLLVFNLAAGKKLVHLSYDLPFNSRPSIKPDEVILVYMDDDAYKELKQPLAAPWDRALHAKLLDRLTTDHARAVVFDIVFSDPGPNAEADAQFAEAMRRNGRVVLAADYVPAGFGQAEGMTLTPPFESFEQATAAWGISQLKEGPDFVVRQHYGGPKDPPLPTLGWAAAHLLNAKITRTPEHRFGERWVNYYGPPRTLNGCSYSQALYPDGTPPGYFSNKVVYVGAHLLTVFSAERKDEFKSPYSVGIAGSDSSKMIFMPGVEVQATVFLNLLRGDWLNRTSAPAEFIIIILAGVVFGFGLSLFRPLIASGLALCGVIAITVIAHYLFWKFRLWFPWMIIVAAQIPIALLWSVVFNSIQLYVQNKLFEQSLALYLSPKLVKKFSSNKELLKPGAKKETLTILFSDIASFTSISEGMDSDELAKHMNSYFQTAVAECIHHTDGTIVKYIGDAIFAFWNAPDLQNDHQFRACQAALRFRDQPPQYMNGQLLVTRIGLHTGVANVGNFGSTARVDYTALGENINLASRMEGLNKYLGTEVLITGETQEGIHGRLITRFLGSFRLKGFERNVEVHELVGPPEKAEGVRAMHEPFTQALKLFQQKDFAAAEAAFQRVLEINPKDGPSKFYLKHIAELKDHPIPEDWSGQVELKEK